MFDRMLSNVSAFWLSYTICRLLVTFQKMNVTIGELFVPLKPAKHVTCTDQLSVPEATYDKLS